MTDVCRNFRPIADISGYSVLVEFSGILGSVESGGNLRLVDFSGFLRFLFRVGTAGYKTFLLAIGGSK